MLNGPTRLMMRDELLGFARSKVMLGLWGILPLLSTAAYFLLPRGLGGGSEGGFSLTTFMGLMLSSTTGTIAAVMVAADLISERTRNVHELFIVRPIRRTSILWAKFNAVFVCVTTACLISLAIGIAVDSMRGRADQNLSNTLMTLGSVTGVIAISTAVGIFFGVLTRSIVLGVILVLYIGQNLAIVPMLPALLGWSEWATTVTLAISAVLTFVVMTFAGMLLNRSDY